MTDLKGKPAGPSAEEFLSGKLRQVDVVAIERELRTLWQSAEATEDEGESPSVARACVLNLILYSSDEDAELSASNMLDEITVSHPCRALLAISRARDVPSLEAWVSARCHLSGVAGTKQICCEQITVRWEGKGVNQLPSAVVPLLQADLPVFLWWRTVHLETRALRPFLAAVDRLLIDSALWDADRLFFSELSEIMKDPSHDVVASDLNWRRILHWRKLIAKAFDSLPLGFGVGDLNTIDSLSIEYAGPSPAQAGLLTGWLASRLKWIPVSATAEGGGKTYLVFRRESQNIKVKWLAVDCADVPPGTLLSAAFSIGAGRTLTVRFTLIDGKPHLAAAAPADGQSREVVGRGPEFSESRLVGHELDILEPDRVFIDTVSATARMIGLL